MQNFWYLFAAYTIVWAALFGFLLLLAFRQRRLTRELEALSEAIKKND